MAMAVSLLWTHVAFAVPFVWHLLLAAMHGLMPFCCLPADVTLAAWHASKIPERSRSFLTSRWNATITSVFALPLLLAVSISQGALWANDSTAALQCSLWFHTPFPFRFTYNIWCQSVSLLCTSVHHACLVGQTWRSEDVLRSPGTGVIKGCEPWHALQIFMSLCCFYCIKCPK